MHFFCGIIVWKYENYGNNIIRKLKGVYFPSKIGVSSKELRELLYQVEKKYENKIDIEDYMFDIFVGEQSFIQQLLDGGYGKSHCVDMVRKGYRYFAKLTRFGI